MGSHELKITLDPQELQDLYQRMGVREIAEHFHVCRQTVRKALMRAGIALRDDRHVSVQKAAWARKAAHANKKYDYQEKPCTGCEKIKSLSEFHRDKNEPDGHRAMCKNCVSEARSKDRANNPEKYRGYHRNRLQAIKNDPEKNAKRMAYARTYAREHHKQNYTWKTYNLSLEEYQSMLEAQNNLCAICGNPEICIDPRSNRLRRLCIDHDHTTGKVRGLLCFKCNTNLALFENKDYMVAVNAYLEKHGGEL